MKKLVLFLLLMCSFSYTYSQYRIKINWNKPVTKKQISPKPVKKEPTVIKNQEVDTNTNTTVLLDNFISRWMGVKYVFGGDSKRGIDCSAFARRLYKSVYRKVLPRTCVYQYKIVKKVTKECLEIGDLIFFKTKGGSGWHVGVFLGNGNFVHASGRGRNVMISSLGDDFYKRIYLSGGRL